ncbi:hypothetical protein FB451DRAFT_1483203 [Mycena latifolia]|nr:hypothetical protein FB451DRAFT_1483203 [Mycena latifolia]
MRENRDASGDGRGTGSLGRMAGRMYGVGHLARGYGYSRSPKGRAKQAVFHTSLVVGGRACIFQERARQGDDGASRMQHPTPKGKAKEEPPTSRAVRALETLRSAPGAVDEGKAKKDMKGGRFCQGATRRFDALGLVLYTLNGPRTRVRTADAALVRRLDAELVQRGEAEGTHGGRRRPFSIFGTLQLRQTRTVVSTRRRRTRVTRFPPLRLPQRAGRGAV